MRGWMLGAVVVGLASPLAGSAVAREGEKTPAQRQAEALAALAPEDRALLQERKVLVAGPPLKQVFEPYLHRELPIFVTSDSLLHGYQVLFDESFQRLEKAQAARLPALLRKVWTNLPSASAKITGNPDLLRRARERAAVVIAVPLRILGEETPGLDPSLVKTVDEEVARVIAAREVAKPDWLGRPDPGFAALDYGRFAPRGFYADTEVLARYFRAVGFLQAIPFRVEMDDELLAALLLGNTVTYQKVSSVENWDLESYFGGYSAFLGQGDDWDLLEAAREAQGNLEFALGSARDDRFPKLWRESLLRKSIEEGVPQLNDQLRFMPDDPTAGAEPGFRVLAAYRLPDAVLFHRTTDPRRMKRAWPNPLEVAALLGSTAARDAVVAVEADGEPRQALRGVLDGAGPLLEGSGSLYGDYLRCLATLLDAPEPDAPRFMVGEAWRAKSFNAALGGWAQMRRTFVLQAKPEAYYLGLTEVEPGFVEPDPEFFSCLASLAERTESLLQKAGAFRGDPREASQCLRDAAALVAKRAKAGVDVMKSLDPAEDALLRKAQELLEQLGGPHFNLYHEDAAPFVEAARKWAASIDGRTTGKEDVVESWSRSLVVDIEPLWKDMARTCRRFESMAQKQLRRVPFNAEEKGFLESYGERLASYLLYQGNAYLTPRDDAPRVVDVYSNPGAGGHLEVGVSRPRRLYVLYDLGKEEILCLGAVLPYREMVAKDRLTDEAWRGLLDAGKIPPSPAWSTPFIGKDAGEKAPAEK